MVANNANFSFKSLKNTLKIWEREFLQPDVTKAEIEKNDEYKQKKKRWSHGKITQPLSFNKP